tara:strand:- start:152 stop:1363 length:1212 start_codon:yes stop_codon:yes gene_type:complete
MKKFKHLFFYATLIVILINCENKKDNSEEISNVDNSEWDLVWFDEFNGSEIDMSKWNKLLWKPGHVNNELQAYTDRDTNIYLDDGHLVIQALIEPGFWGEDYNGEEYNSDYTSGRLNTDNKANWLYGRFDISAKLPQGNGSWPAIWMLGENISSVGWPHCGEIDIMEHVGFDEGNIHGSIHTTDFNHMLNTQRSGSRTIPTATDSFHTYSLEWSPTYLRYLIDNEPFHFIYNDSDGDINKWPFVASQYMILNLAIGGDWGGINGIDVSAFPMKMFVDYVRVSKRKSTTPDINVKFQVDMKNVNIHSTGVRLSGGDISSGYPGGFAMSSQSDTTNIWEISLTLPPNSTFTYKFRNGFFPNDWEGGWEIVDSDCQADNNGNRSVILGNQDTTLLPICFERCMICD